ncbi:MAG: NUDIX domain-containing protein [Actinomycetales bacterium]|nr:NUDIX domain-containing protein [Actinomycetales bacterium]
MSTRVHVVGAVIVDDGRVLCAQRGPGSDLAGLWEFPGGKVEDGESLPAALQREIEEELGCSVAVGTEVTTTTHMYPAVAVTLTTFYCTLTAGTPRPHEHAAIRWLRPAELHELEWAPADLPAVALVASTVASPGHHA